MGQRQSQQPSEPDYPELPADLQQSIQVECSHNQTLACSVTDGPKDVFPFDELPPELQLLCLKHLDTATLSSFRATCRRYRNLVDSNGLDLNIQSQVSELFEKVLVRQKESQKTMETIIYRQDDFDRRLREMVVKDERTFQNVERAVDRQNQLRQEISDKMANATFELQRQTDRHMNMQASMEEQVLQLQNTQLPFEEFYLRDWIWTRQLKKKVDHISSLFSPLSTAETVERSSSEGIRSPEVPEDFPVQRTRCGDVLRRLREEEMQPSIYFEFDKGRVVFKIYNKCCPKTCELFLKIMRKEPIDGANEIVQLTYRERHPVYGHVFSCQHPFKMWAEEDDYNTFCGKRWGIRIKRCMDNETLFVLEPMKDDYASYFGEVKDGEEILDDSWDDYKHKMVLIDYGTIE